MAQRARSRLWYGWVVLAVAFVGYLLVVGFLAYIPPVAMPRMWTELGWGRAEASAPITLQSWLLIPFAPIGGWCITRYGARPMLTIYGLGVGVVFLGLSQVTVLWQWFALRGIFWAIPAILGGPGWFTLANIWFNLRRGLAVGLIVFGGGVAGLILPPVATLVMEAAKSWQVAWAVGGILVAAGGVLVAIFVRSKPADMGTWPDGLSPEEAQRAREAALAGRASGQRAIATTYRTPINWRVRDALRTRAVWLTVLANVGHFFSYMIIANHSVLHLTRSVGYSSMEAAFSISLWTIVSSPFRFIVGWLTDRVESRYVLAVGDVLTAVGVAILWLLPAGNPLMLYTYAVVFGISLGLVFPAVPAQLGNYYGGTTYPQLTTWTASPVGGFFNGVAPLFAGWIFDTQGSYGTAFATAIGIALIAAVGVLFATPPRPKEVTAPRPIS